MVVALLIFGLPVAQAQPSPDCNLSFDTLAGRWDDAMPLGNGMLGALVWKRNDMMRISLDRADLWDERPSLDLKKFNFEWVRQQVLANRYDTVQRLGDQPYEDSAYPTKIPAGALEFDIKPFGPVRSNVLDISRALNTIRFENGVVCNIYVHATRMAGYFGFDHLRGIPCLPVLGIPGYNTGLPGGNGNSVEGLGLPRLGYPKGRLTRQAHSILYHQPTAGKNYYEIYVEWNMVSPGHMIGAWTITCNKPARGPLLQPRPAEPTGWSAHQRWWKSFWHASSVSIPEPALQKQYYLEMYKLGSVARPGAPAITLQAIWTADNGNLPPWKGDFHNDLNTQLSYWPTYTSNHLREAATFTDWLWKIRGANLRYTRQYFGVGGLNVPGVATLHGFPLGGWVQYSLSPTISAWLSQHFYWQWKYSMDKQLLIGQVYPYFHEVAVYLEEITRVQQGKRALPLSSSPEYFDNSIRAWFTTWTNYDLSLVKYVFSRAAEVCDSCGKSQEAIHWRQRVGELPGFAINQTGLMVAPGQELEQSHRHMSPYMAIYPLGLLNVDHPEDKVVIDQSLRHIEQKGTRQWCGYSFSWMACLYARAQLGDSAASMLRIFASNFCAPNSFHLNGDQKGGQYSDFVYRPFTLEGNFAFAQGLQEMLLQSHQGFIQVLPAVPASWDDISFTDLRAEGAFLVSVKKQGGILRLVTIRSARNSLMRIRLPFKTFLLSDPAKKYSISGDILSISMAAGEILEIRNGNQ